jgi:hypothetical protein
MYICWAILAVKYECVLIQLDNNIETILKTLQATFQRHSEIVSFHSQSLSHSSSLGVPTSISQTSSSNNNNNNQWLVRHAK